MISKLKKTPNLLKFQELRNRGVTRTELKKLLDKGTINRVSRGYYQFAENDFTEENMFLMAKKIVGDPHAICMLSALEFYQITDHISKKIWIMVPVGIRRRNKNLRLYRTRNPHWNIGIKKESGFCVTTIERTIVDVLTNNSVLSTNIGLDALKTALQLKKTTLSKILEIAKALKVQHRIIKYIEALS